MLVQTAGFYTKANKVINNSNGELNVNNKTGEAPSNAEQKTIAQKLAERARKVDQYTTVKDGKIVVRDGKAGEADNAARKFLKTIHKGVTKGNDTVKEQLEAITEKLKEALPDIEDKAKKVTEEVPKTSKWKSVGIPIAALIVGALLGWMLKPKPKEQEQLDTMDLLNDDNDSYQPVSEDETKKELK